MRQGKIGKVISTIISHVHAIGARAGGNGMAAVPVFEGEKMALHEF